jgi:hypothetical protein
LLRWTKFGQKLFSGEFLRHLSPRWMMRKISDRIFQPIRLISVRMTNHPNLCGEGDAAIAGHGQGLQPIENAGNASGVCGKNEIKSAPLANSIGDGTSSEAACVELPGCKDDGGKVCAESGDVPDGKDFTANSDSCGKNGNGLHIDSLTENLSKRYNGQSRGDRILALVHEQMMNFGDDYQSAWNTVKRQFPALFREKFESQTKAYHHEKIDIIQCCRGHACRQHYEGGSGSNHAEVFAVQAGSNRKNFNSQ